MTHSENGQYGAKFLHIQTKVFRYIKAYQGNFLKRISTGCRQCSSSNIRLSDIQGHTLCEKYFK